MANKVKEIWASGKVVVNAWLAIPSGFSAEVIAQCGFDSVTVDMQHGVQDYLSMVQCFQAMNAHPVTPLVRVPWNEPGIIATVRGSPRRHQGADRRGKVMTQPEMIDVNEQKRLNEAREAGIPWKKWGPYLSEAVG